MCHQPSTLTQSRICFVLLFGKRVMGMLAKCELCMKNAQRQIRPEKNTRDEAGLTRAVWQTPRMQPTVVSEADWKAQLFPAVPSVFLKLRRVYRSFRLQINIYWFEFQVSAGDSKPPLRNMSGMQSGLRSWRNGGNRRMEQSRDRERQRSQLASTCAGRSACLAARCLPDNKQASDYDMNVNLNVYQQRVWLSRSVGRCGNSWHAQKPPPFPLHHAHGRLCCSCGSFVTVHTWVSNPFDSLGWLYCFIV